MRAYADDNLIADSKSVLIKKGPGHIPEYVFPEQDVNSEYLSKNSRDEDPVGTFHWFSLKNSGNCRERAGKVYDRTVSGAEILEGRYIMNWEAFEQWREEDEIVSTHPRDPYTRIDIRESDRRVEVRVCGEKIAETARPKILFETGLPARFYFPPDAVKISYLKPSKSETSCPYKGKASYWDVEVSGDTVRDAVWSYVEPFDESAGIRGYFCFYDSKVDSLIVDGEDMTANK